MIGENRHPEYHLDERGNIVDVSPAFLAFARDNEAPHLTADAVIGKPIWSFIEGTGTREIYANIFDRVRKTDRALSIPFRCDSPTCRRFMELNVAPAVGGSIHLTAILLRSETRPAVALLDPQAPRMGTMLEACSFCKSIHIPGGEWMQVEDAVRQMKLLEAPQLPGLSHSVCPNCLPEFRRSLGF